MLEKNRLYSIFGKETKQKVDFLYNIVEQIKIPEGAEVLDVGTGRGIMAAVLAVHGYSVITGEPEGHNWADWKSAIDNLNLDDKIKFQHFEAERIPFENKSFTYVFLFNSLHHISEKQQAFDEIMRILKRNGILCVIEFTEKGVNDVKQTKPHHPEMIDPRVYSVEFKVEIKIVESELMNAYIFKKL